MASLYPKKVGGKTYWYLREMGRVDGKPKMISERYLGTAADIAAAMETREAAGAAGTDPAPGLRGRRRRLGNPGGPRGRCGHR